MNVVHGIAIDPRMRYSGEKVIAFIDTLYQKAFDDGYAKGKEAGYKDGYEAANYDLNYFKDALRRLLEID